MSDPVTNIPNESGIRRAYTAIPDRGDDWVFDAIEFIPDWETQTVKIKSGKLLIAHNDRLYYAETDTRPTVAIPSGSNGVYYSINTTTDRGDITIQSSAPSEPYLQLGTIDHGAETYDDGYNRNPSETLTNLNTDSVSTDQQATVKYVDASDSLKSAIEDVDGDGGGVIKPKSESGVTLTPSSVVAPTTNGNRVIVDSFTIDLSNIADQSGDIPLIDLTAASNVTFRNVTITDKNRGAVNWSLQVGSGFRFHHLTLSTGAGALDIVSSDVQGCDLVVDDQRDTAGGAAAGLHISGDIQDIYIDGIDIRDCDRGVETEDGAKHVHLQNGYLKNIDNSSASSPQSQFSLDVHTHATQPDIRDIKYESFVVEDCTRGFTITGAKSDGLIENVVYEDITQIDSGHASDTDSAIVTAQSADLRNIEFRNPDTNPDTALRVRGGNPTLDGIAVNDAPSTQFIKLEISDDIPDGDVTIRDLRGDGGSGTTSHLVHVPGTSGSYDTLTVADSTNTGSPTRCVTVRSGMISDSLTVRDCNFVNCNLEIESNNGHVVVRGGTQGGTPTNMPEGAEIHNVDQIDSRVYSATNVFVDGVATGTYTGDGSTGRTISISNDISSVIIEGGDGSLYSVFRHISTSSPPIGSDSAGELSLAFEGFTVGDNSADADPNTDGETYTYRVTL